MLKDIEVQLLKLLRFNNLVKNEKLICDIVKTFCKHAAFKSNLKSKGSFNLVRKNAFLLNVTQLLRQIKSLYALKLKNASES